MLYQKSDGLPFVPRLLDGREGAFIEFNGKHERLAGVPENFRIVRDEPIPSKVSARRGDRLEGES